LFPDLFAIFHGLSLRFPLERSCATGITLANSTMSHGVYSRPILRFSLTCGMETGEPDSYTRSFHPRERLKGGTRLPAPETEPKAIHLYAVADTSPMRNSRAASYPGPCFI
jgi:hypothetical protein